MVSSTSVSNLLENSKVCEPIVYSALYTLLPSDEVALDLAEQVPSMYSKQNMSIEVLSVADGVVSDIKVELRYPEVSPSVKRKRNSWIWNHIGHPSTLRLYKVLKRARHDPSYRLIERITKFCRDCQFNGKSPGRFKFTLHDPDSDFNHTVIVDILDIDGKKVLQVIDEATGYMAAAFLKNQEAATAYSALQTCQDIC